MRHSVLRCSLYDMKKLSISVVPLLALCTSHVTAVCNNVWVTGALNYHSSLNGEYYVNVATCSDRYSWTQVYGSDHIYYVNGRWVIGNYICDGSTLSIEAQADDGDYEQPYDVPMGSWKEWSPNGYYESSPYLYIYCEEGLTGWEIFGIVIGCICGVILIGVCIYFIYVCCCKKKQSRPTTPAPNTAAAQQQRTNNVVVMSNQYYVPPTVDAMPMTYVGCDPGYNYNASMPPPYDPSTQYANYSV